MTQQEEMEPKRVLLLPKGFTLKVESERQREREIHTHRGAESSERIQMNDVVAMAKIVPKGMDL